MVLDEDEIRIRNLLTHFNFINSTVKQGVNQLQDSYAIPLLPAIMMATGRGYAELGQSIVADTYAVLVGRGIPETAAAVIASSRGEFRNRVDGLDRVVDNYNAYITKNSPIRAAQLSLKVDSSLPIARQDSFDASSYA